MGLVYLHDRNILHRDLKTQVCVCVCVWASGWEEGQYCDVTKYTMSASDSLHLPARAEHLSLSPRSRQAR